MVTRIDKLLSNNKFFLLCLAFVVFNLGAYLFPVSYWYELNKVKIQDTKVGSPIYMAMDQTINRPFVGRRAVTIKHLNGTTNVNDAGETVCSHYGSNNYSSNDQLPEKLTLGWYTADICKSLPPGFYMATTIMHIEVVNFLQPKYVINESNIFEIKE